MFAHFVFQDPLLFSWFETFLITLQTYSVSSKTTQLYNSENTNSEKNSKLLTENTNSMIGGSEIRNPELIFGTSLLHTFEIVMLM